MATATYSASLRTRKSNSSSNYKSSAASQEFYENTYNFVGIISFSGMNLTNKVITGITWKATSSKAGYGAGHTKTVYMRKANYQNATTSATGLNYVGDALGTFTGSFYNNTTSYALTGTLLANMAAYISAGNNTFTIYNPSPSASSQGYSGNYLEWTSVTITVTYQEAVSVPSVSAASINMGTSVTIYTNRLSTAATHTISYSFGSASGTIATNVGDSCIWTPPVSLAAQIPRTTLGVCTITCSTYYSEVLTGTATCIVTLNVPSNITPTLSLQYHEGTSGISTQFGCYVKNKSTLTVTITASGNQGSSISSYRTTVNGATYTTGSFTTGALGTAGTNAITCTVTDSRGRTATATANITVVDYSPPSLTHFSAERCNSGGTAVQTDGTRILVNITGAVSPVNSRNTVSCKVYYKLKTASSWTQSTTITASSYSVNKTNLLLSQTFNALNSYDLKVSLTDFFATVEQVVSVGTKQVMMDFYRDGSGIAFGKVAESSGKAEFAWPIKLPSALPITEGGTGATTAAAARTALGAAASSHTHTAADVGAAASGHTHTLASLGAAGSSHTHTLRNLGLIIQSGISDTVSVSSGSYTDLAVTFPTPFPTVPLVQVCWYTNSTAGTFGRCCVAVLSWSVTENGFTARLYNGDSAGRSPRITWLAISVP